MTHLVPNTKVSQVDIPISKVNMIKPIQTTDSSKVNTKLEEEIIQLFKVSTPIFKVNMPLEVANMTP